MNKDNETDADIAQLEQALAGETEENKKIDSAVKNANLGGMSSFKGLQLKPVTLSTLAILEKLKSPLVTGEQSSNNVLEALIFLWVQSAPKEEVTSKALTAPLDSRINVEVEALELGEKLGLTDMEELVDVVSGMMSESQLTKVQQIPNEELQKQNKSKNK